MDGSDLALATITQAPTEALVFIDETGVADFSDKAQPVFGFGGIVLMGNEYEDLCDAPWRVLKEGFFDGAHSVLHAAAIRPSSIQIEALCNFFNAMAFVRVGAITKVTTTLTPGYDPARAALNAFHVCVGRVIKLYVDAAVPVSRVNYIFEDSPGTQRLLRTYFTGGNLRCIPKLGEPYAIPLARGIRRKKDNDSGIQVADFVCHAANRQVRARVQDVAAGWKPDFKVVFRSNGIDQYMDVDTAESTPNGSPPRPDGRGVDTIGIGEEPDDRLARMPRGWLAPRKP